MTTRMVRFAGLIAGIAALGACGKVAQVVQSELTLRPEGQRMIDYLSSAQGQGTLQGAANKPVLATSPQLARSFTGKITFDPYNAPVLSRSRVHRELIRVKDCMLAAWPGPSPKLNLIVGSGLAPSAQALPDEISINVGLLAANEIDAYEVAFVLAHELSHVLLRHYEREEFLRDQKKAAETMAQVAIVAAYASEMRARRQGNQIIFVLDDEGAVTEAAMITMAAFAASQVLADGVFESSWSRVQEFEADQLAYDLMEAVGHPGRAGYQNLSRLEDWDKIQKLRLERFAGIAEARMEEAAQTANPNLIIKTAVGVFSQAVTTAVLDLWEYLDSTHPSPDQRIEQLGEYEAEIAALDDATVRNDCSLDRLDRALKDRRIDATKNALQSAIDSEIALSERRMDEARRLAKAGLRAGLDRHAVPRMAAFRVEQNLRRNTRAMGHLEKIRQNASTPLGAYLTIASEQIVHKRYSRARRTIRNGERHFARDFFYATRMQLASAQGDLEEVARLYALCKASDVPDLEDVCSQVASNRASAATGEGFGDAAGGIGDVLRGLSEGLDKAVTNNLGN